MLLDVGRCFLLRGIANILPLLVNRFNPLSAGLVGAVRRFVGVAVEISGLQTGGSEFEELRPPEAGVLLGRSNVKNLVFDIRYAVRLRHEYPQ